MLSHLSNLWVIFKFCIFIVLLVLLNGHPKLEGCCGSEATRPE